MASTDKTRVTMKDVALLAGVSQSTVSFVLNRMENMRISEDTRQQVLRAVEQLGYRPRGAGRPRKTEGTQIIGLMFDEIATSPFAAISIEGAQEAAWKCNVIVEVVMTGADREYEAQVLDKWSQENVMGVIYGSILTRELNPPEVLLKQRSVLLNCNDIDARLPSVVPAERRGGEEATATLIANGHRRIAFISANLGWRPLISEWKAMSVRCVLRGFLSTPHSSSKVTFCRRVADLQRCS